MNRALILPLLCGAVGLSNAARAAPIIMNKTEAVSPPRQDVGTGICGSVIKFTNQATPVNTVDEATMLLNRSMGDPNIVGRVSRLISNVNMSIGLGSEADFRAPMFPDEIFPYCNDPGAMPMGSDDNNIAVRIRGYLNVTDTMNGQPVTLAVRCDDGCALRLGATRQIVTTADARSPVLTGRRARSVVFQDSGLYPVELVYYQNATSGYLELSSAMGMSFASDDTAVSNSEWTQKVDMFKPLGGAALFSAMTGVSSDCQECDESAASCATGSYCGNGLCQTCNLPDHCGSSCVACPMDKHICSAGKCVQCTSDDACGMGGRCDAASGACVPPMSCTTNDQCRSAEVCRPDGICGSPPAPCALETDCQGGQKCACADDSMSCDQKVCLMPPAPCASTADCPMNQACDTSAQRCVARLRLSGGGFVTCDVNAGGHRGRDGFGLLMIAGLTLLGLMVRMRHRERA